MRPIAPPPPEIVTQLSELVTLVLNIDAVAKTVADLKAASDEYHQAKLDYEVEVSKANLAHQALDEKERELAPLIAKAIAEAEEAKRANADLAQARADLQAGFANVESRVAEVEAREKAVAAAETERLAELDRQIEQARKNAEESAAIKEALAAKLALLRE